MERIVNLMTDELRLPLVLRDRLGTMIDLPTSLWLSKCKPLHDESDLRRKNLAVRHLTGDLKTM